MPAPLSLQAGGVRVVVAGGHTAGHIEPAMAVADAVMRLAPASHVTALGTVRGLDTRLIPARGYPLELIPPVPLPRKVGMQLARTPRAVHQAVAQTRRILREVSAQVVVGFGGYVAAPAYLAARWEKIPFVVHEANARPGLANQFAARLTPHVFTASDAVRLPHAQPIGIPLRPQISHLDRMALRVQARERFGLNPEGLTLLVTGGSQGAQAINSALEQARADLHDARIQVLHIVGPKNEAVAGLPGDSVPYVAVNFVEEMQYAYAAADFVLCRSGAMTVAELTAVGLPAAYVPFPLRGGEQRLNAEPVVAAGGGVLVDNADLSAEWIRATVIPQMSEPATLAAMTAAAARAGAGDADEVLARAVLELIRAEANE